MNCIRKRHVPTKYSTTNRKGNGGDSTYTIQVASGEQSKSKPADSWGITRGRVKPPSLRQSRDFSNSEMFASDPTFEPLSGADLAIANFTLQNNVRL
jgi:hypothetical protein